MAKDYGKKKKPYLRALVLGAISLTAYILVFSNQDLATDLSTRGSAYAALPILAVFFFSFVHGTFASDLLTILGLEAKKKK